eukprot:TRINITY_DN1956_c0_g3_i1.p1 TRINITY_DN1956_c0_g3~~TRINITY_DN1956_c0_g3_i1.p1  ORF type:complete len:925 (-),score=216.08 TRINITY_DN1956_c0_g3_i1:24-2705(-)
MAHHNKDTRERVQHKAIYRLCHTFLSRKNLSLEDSLDSGVLDDGLLLATLISVLSKKELKDVGKLDLPAKTRFGKLSNLNSCFDFLRDDGVKLVGIGPEDVLARNEKLIMGMIWTLMVHYHVTTLSMGEHAELKELLSTYDFPHTTSNRNDYLKLMVIFINKIIPGAISRDLLMEHVSENVEMCMKVAETILRIPHIIDVDDFISEICDETVFMAYLSFFREKYMIAKNLGGLLFPCKKLQQKIPKNLVLSIYKGLNHLDNLDFCFGVTTKLFFRSYSVDQDKEQLEKKIVVKTDDEIVGGGSEVCRVEIERINQVIWLVKFTPSRKGNLHLGVSLQNPEGTISDDVLGFPRDIFVKEAPGYFFQISEEIFSPSRVVGSLGCGGGVDSSGMSVSVEGHSSVQISGSGKRFEFSVPRNFDGSLSFLATASNGITVATKQVKVKKKPHLKWHILSPFCVANMPFKALLHLENLETDQIEVKLIHPDKKNMSIGAIWATLECERYGSVQFIPSCVGTYQLVATFITGMGSIFEDKLDVDVRPCPYSTVIVDEQQFETISTRIQNLSQVVFSLGVNTNQSKSEIEKICKFEQEESLWIFLQVPKMINFHEDLEKKLFLTLLESLKFILPLHCRSARILVDRLVEHEEKKSLQFFTRVLLDSLRDLQECVTQKLFQPSLPQEYSSPFVAQVNTIIMLSASFDLLNEFSEIHKNTMMEKNEISELLCSIDKMLLSIKDEHQHQKVLHSVLEIQEKASTHIRAAQLFGLDVTREAEKNELDLAHKNLCVALQTMLKTTSLQKESKNPITELELERTKTSLNNLLLNIHQKDPKNVQKSCRLCKKELSLLIGKVKKPLDGKEKRQHQSHPHSSESHHVLQPQLQEVEISSSPAFAKLHAAS